MAREIVLDTETTGLRPEQGDRVVEIGCIELVNYLPTGQRYHQYINPERTMPAGAFAVHGLSDSFLAQHPVFAAIAGAFLDFIGDAPLIIHNASFDMGFLNAELRRLNLPLLRPDRAIDTVQMARQRFPGAQASLDALCKRFNIDNTNRTLHGALLDAQLLADVYLELRGGRQQGLSLGGSGAGDEARSGYFAAHRPARPVRPARPHTASPDELAAHAALLDTLKEPLWRA